MRNILITGHKGFLGSYVYKILNNKYNTIGFDYPDNFTDKITTEVCFRLNKIDTIVHIGAMAGLEKCMDNPIDAFWNNVWGTQVLLKVAKKYNCKFIHTSTWAVNGLLGHPYDVSKKMSEDLVTMYNKVYGLQTMILRLATMYGPGMRKNGVIWAFLEKSLNGEEITIKGDGNQYRQFLWVEDAAGAYLKSVEDFKSGEIHEVQAKERVSVRQLAQIVYPDMKKVKFTEKRKGDEESFYIESTKTLGWEAKTSIKEGMEKLKKCIQNENVS